MPTPLTLLRLLAGWSLSLLILPPGCLALLLLPAERRRRHGYLLARAWGRTMLAIAGIRVRLTPRGGAALSGRRARVLTLNHSSSLDLVVFAAHYPIAAVTVAKAELRRIPALGLATSLLGAIYIDRGDPVAARRTLREAAAQVVAGRLCVLVAPEGTRNRGEELLPFKTGGLELALHADVPVEPIVLRGCRDRWPRGAFGPQPGEVVIDGLPPLRVVDGPPDALRAQAAALRSAYVAALAGEAEGVNDGGAGGSARPGEAAR
jgi:1-acyl-sn-glycerol-3-phosphate acyltransferase